MKLNITFKGKDKLFRSLITIEKQLEEGMEDANYKAGQAIAHNIRSNWSYPSPSAPFERPAVVTGNLDSSIRVDKLSQGAGGRFIQRTGEVYVRLNTANGANPRNVLKDGSLGTNRGNYAQVLEFGRQDGNPMQPRPFIQPAVEEVSYEYPQIIKETVRLRP